jgi:hypothetical protein
MYPKLFPCSCENVASYCDCDGVKSSLCIRPPSPSPIPDLSWRVTCREIALLHTRTVLLCANAAPLTTTDGSDDGFNLWSSGDERTGMGISMCRAWSCSALFSWTSKQHHKCRFFYSMCSFAACKAVVVPLMHCIDSRLQVFCCVNVSMLS